MRWWVLVLSPLLALLPPAARAAPVVEGSGGGGGEARETHLAECEVATEHLAARASARASASASRVLQGVCTAKDMERLLAAMEGRLSSGLEAVRAALLALEDRVHEDANVRRAHAQCLEAAAAAAADASRTLGPRVSPAWGLPLAHSEEDAESAWSGLEEEGEEAGEEVGVNAPRVDEIRRLNASEHVLPDGRRVFSYFWRVWEMERRLRGGSGPGAGTLPLLSPRFYVTQGGYRMYLRVVTRRGPPPRPPSVAAATTAADANAFVHVGVAPGAFDAQLPWPFALKVRVSVLEQRGAAAAEDVASRVWAAAALCPAVAWTARPAPPAAASDCPALGVPRALLLSRRYLWRGSLLLRLTVFL